MKVNLTKTKIMVFRNGGIIKKNENWFYENEKIEATTYYKYLGLMISSRLSWHKATHTLAAQGKKALMSIKRVIYKCNGIDLKVAFELFDSMILPIVTYGAEIWGFTVYEKIEQVQYHFCKYVLGVSSNTSNHAVLGECGRHPLFIHYYLKCIKYWVKLLHMDNNRLPKATYNMLYMMDQNGKINWVTNVKNILYKYGFGYVFISQNIGNCDIFINSFKTRLMDCSVQEWSTGVNNNSKLNYYTIFKSMLEPEKYLSCIEIKKYKIALTRFRCSNHNLEIEIGRRQNINKQERLCKFCVKNGKNCIEDEYHFVCVCNLYQEIRTKYINYVKNYTQREFCMLMKTENCCKLNELSKFIFFGMLHRTNYLNK